MADKKSELQNSASTMVGVTCVALLVLGFASFFMAFAAMAAKNFVGMGLSLIAAALALGFLVSAIARK